MRQEVELKMIAEIKEDIKSIIEQSNGAAAISDVIGGLRGSWRSPYSPKSGRRWRIGGGPVGQEDMLRRIGFDVTQTNKQRGGGYLTLVTIAE